jgi:hypothetical protein
MNFIEGYANITNLLFESQEQNMLLIGVKQKWKMKNLSYLFVHHMCFECTTLCAKSINMWNNDIRTISITKSWDEKFVMYTYQCWLPK